MSSKEDFVKELIADPTPYKKFSKTFSDDEKKSEQVNYDASVHIPTIIDQVHTKRLTS